MRFTAIHFSPQTYVGARAADIRGIPQKQGKKTSIEVRVYNSHLYGEPNQAGNVMSVQPVHEVCTVAFHRLYAQVEKARNFFGGFAFSHKLKHLALAFGEQVMQTCPIAYAFEIPLHDGF